MSSILVGNKDDRSNFLGAQSSIFCNFHYFVHILHSIYNIQYNMVYLQDYMAMLHCYSIILIPFSGLSWHL